MTPSAESVALGDRPGLRRGSTSINRFRLTAASGLLELLLLATKLDVLSASFRFFLFPSFKLLGRGIYLCKTCRGEARIFLFRRHDGTSILMMMV